MCTVTFIPKSDGSFILTSSRDEAPGRATLAPAVYTIDEVQCLFPKDAVAGGTWLGVSENNRLICLLNGGFTAHKREASYKMSRGIVVKKLLVASDIISEVESFDFTGIEPFTIIAIAYGLSLNVYELVWDGNSTHFSEKLLEPTIWSSSLLYNQEMKLKREQWFSNYLQSQDTSKERILNFHKTAGEGNLDIDLVMDRGFVKTKAITQVVKDSLEIKMRYEDLQMNTISEEKFTTIN